MAPNISPRYGFYGLGGLCIALGLQHAVFEGDGIGTLLESLIIWILAIVVLRTAYNLSESNISHSGQWRSFYLSIGVSISFALLAVIVWLIWHLEGSPAELSFLVSFASTLGVAVGTRGSLYAIETQETLKEAQELSKLLQINQRVMRHNVRNELSIVLGYLDELERDTTASAREQKLTIIRKRLESLLDNAERTRQLVSIWEEKEKRELDLTKVIEAQQARVQEEYPDRTLTTDLPESCRVRVNSAFSLAIEEAIENAFEHNPADTAVSVVVKEDRDSEVVIEIKDTGEGIPSVDQEAINTSEETPLIHTLGLGLWVIYWVAEMSDGRVEIKDKEPQGTIVRIILPQSRSGPIDSYW
ncbi:signal transduction histidine kinase [Halarchaeum solikamskense]|uniref:sensor histidine kinase n=1 Tax=Halarchaeum nitratireducens TaxID=489913 RepID=UPI001B3AB5AA|nr:HAMP domain-containing sensor histidine kinase [Halarchaeum solikamskense]MBP2251125.1 signal transduction histidine kinase [Halarchaeum solikamskense]